MFEVARIVCCTAGSTVCKPRNPHSDKMIEVKGNCAISHSFVASRVFVVN